MHLYLCQNDTPLCKCRILRSKVPSVFWQKRQCRIFLSGTEKPRKQCNFATIKKSKPVTEDIFISQLFRLKADKPKQGHLADKQ